MSVAIPVRSKEPLRKPPGWTRLLPRTYEERGVVVPFTTPLLAYARLRKDYRQRLELSLGRFNDADGNYVVALDSVTELATLTTHDMMLQERLIDQRAADPATTRMASLEAAATGLAGLEVAEAANKAVAEEASAESVNRATLILDALKEVNAAANRDLPDDVMTPGGQKLIRETLLSTDGLPLGAEEIVDRLDAIATSTATVGTSTSPVEGRLRRLLKRLHQYRASLTDWSQERVSVAAADASFCAQIAGITMDNARKLLAEIDDKLTWPVDLVMDENHGAASIEDLARRLGFVLDGWDPVMAVWLNDQPKPEADAVAAIKEMLSALPLPPLEAFPENVRQQIVGFAERTKGWVRLNVDWLTGEPDRDLIERLETRKKEP
jgi:hypothetical protein